MYVGRMQYGKKLISYVGPAEEAALGSGHVHKPKQEEVPYDPEDTFLARHRSLCGATPIDKESLDKHGIDIIQKDYYHYLSNYCIKLR